MPRRLIIMRHAQSLQINMHADHSRPLDNLGEEQAPKIAQQLAQLQWIPDFIICSDAKRTQETWKLMEPTLGQVNIRFSHELYHATVDEILTTIENKAKNSQTLMLLGHNPTSEALVEWLCSQYIELGTANAALLEADLNWPDISNQKGQWNFRNKIKP